MRDKVKKKQPLNKCIFFLLCLHYTISAKSKIWTEVEQYFTESESRVRNEVQQIDGEDFQVWRWVQPMAPGMA